MKINEVIQEGVWDNLKTAGQNVKQRVGTVGQNIKQGAGAVANKVGQGARSAYNTVVQPYARQQRFSQAAAQQFEPKTALGTEWSPQAQLRAKNAGSFAGDVAGTIAKAGGGVGSGSMMAKATSTIPKQTIPVGAELEVPEIGKFKMTPAGAWYNEKNQPIIEPNQVDALNQLYYRSQDKDQVDTQSAQQVPQVDTSKIQPAPRAGQPTSDEQAKFQQKLQAAMQKQV
jgi:hypothetical protein